MGPLLWLVAVTFTASWHKVFDPNPRIGFLSHAAQLAAGPAANARLIFNDRLDAVVTGALIVMVALILIESAVEWLRVLVGTQAAKGERVAIRAHAIRRGARMKDTTSHVGTAALGCPVERSSTSALLQAPFERLKSCAQIFVATLHEIFDESAYARFLEQKQLVSSRCGLRRV